MQRAAEPQPKGMWVTSGLAETHELRLGKVPGPAREPGKVPALIPAGKLLGEEQPCWEGPADYSRCQADHEPTACSCLR